MDREPGSSTARTKRSLEVTVAKAKILRKNSQRNVKNKKVLTKKRKSKKLGKKRNFAKCDRCKKKFSSVSAKNVHIETKHKGRRFICSLCGEDYHSKFAYERHLKRKHEDVEAEGNEGAENSVYITEKIEMTTAAKDALIKRLRTENEDKDRQIAEFRVKVAELEEQLEKINTLCAKVFGRPLHESPPNPSFELHAPPPNTSSNLMPAVAIKAFEQWITKDLASGNLVCNELVHGTDLMEQSHQDLNQILKCFIEGVRKPNNDSYAPDTIFYLTLGIQKFLYENNRNGSIFLDPEYMGVAESLNKVLEKFHSMHEGLNTIKTRVNEDMLWDSRQLGVFSPWTFLQTLIYSNMKYLNIKSLEEHSELKFSSIVNESEDSILLLKYVPSDGAENEKNSYKQQVIDSSPYRCPVKHHDFYLSKCPKILNMSECAYYLMPKDNCSPEDDVWFTKQKLDSNKLRFSFTRLSVVEELLMTWMSE